MAKEIEQRNGYTYIQWIVALLANLATFSYGMECGWTSPIIKLLQSDESPTGVAITDNQMSWIACLMSLVATIGVPIFYFIVLKLGSKRAIILLTIPQILSWVIRILHSTATTIIIARIISGLSAGGVFNVVPMYVKEISQDSIRGTLGSLMILMQNSGIFVMYVMGAYLDYFTVMYIAVALPVVLAVLMIKAPQSPAYLVKQEKFEEATNVIALPRGLDKNDKRVLSELEYMKNEEAQYQALPDMSYLVIVKDKTWRRGLILIFLTFTCHALNGAFVILTYASAILESTGVEFQISPELQTLSLPIVMIATNIVLIIIVERCGRKVILSSAFLISSVSMVTLGSAILVTRAGGAVPSWLPVAAMVSIVSMYAGGISPIPYIVMTELFNFQVRSKVMGFIVTYAWFTTFISVVVFAPVSAALGIYSAFFIYGTVNLLGAVFVVTFLPETSGKSDEEIRQILRRTDKTEQKITP